jgi:hypothetical protein
MDFLEQGHPTFFFWEGRWVTKDHMCDCGLIRGLRV